MLKAIASELRKAGFETSRSKQSVTVSLNRRVNTVEVSHALDQIFEGIEFTVRQNGKSVSAAA